MIFKKFLRTAAVSAVAIMTIGAGGNWNASVVKTDRAYQIGNQDAEVTLTEFVSYTCPHCATFTKEGEPALQIAYIGPGKLKFEIRSVIRNVVDLTATLAVQCGEPDKYLRNHTIFMTKQDTWLDVARNANRAQQQRWMVTDKAAARRSIASDLGFYPMMETRGYNRTDVDRCLSDEAEAKRLVANTTADFADFGIAGTPSFAINGEFAEGVHNWSALEPVLNSNF